MTTTWLLKYILRICHYIHLRLDSSQSRRNISNILQITIRPFTVAAADYSLLSRGIKRNIIFRNLERAAHTSSVFESLKSSSNIWSHRLSIQPVMDRSLQGIITTSPHLLRTFMYSSLLCSFSLESIRSKSKYWSKLFELITVFYVLYTVSGPLSRPWSLTRR